MDSTPGLLTVRQVADAAGIQPDTLRSYLSRGQCQVPEPDGGVEGVVTWRRETILPWIKGRAGR